MDEELGIGGDTWVTLSDLQEERDLKPFFNNVRAFYLASIAKMLKISPFSDTLLRDLAISQPENTVTFTKRKVHELAKRFRQLSLHSPDTLSRLGEEFDDFCLSPSELPKLEQNQAGDGTEKPKAASFW